MIFRHTIIDTITINTSKATNDATPTMLPNMAPITLLEAKGTIEGEMDGIMEGEASLDVICFSNQKK